VDQERAETREGGRVGRREGGRGGERKNRERMVGYCWNVVGIISLAMQLPIIVNAPLL
jgi:hypothetical protein